MNKDAATQLRLESQIVVRNLKVKELQTIKQREAVSIHAGEDSVMQTTIKALEADIVQLDQDIWVLRQG